MATTELNPTREYPKAAPLTPYLRAKKGRSTQLKTVHIIIRPKVTFIFPIEFKRLVSCVVAAAIMALKEIR